MLVRYFVYSALVLGAIAVLILGLIDGKVTKWESSDGMTTIGLYPEASSFVDRSGHKVLEFLYRSDFVRLNRGQTPAILTDRLQIKNWDIVWKLENSAGQIVDFDTNGTIDLLDESPFRVRATLTYQGSMDTLRNGSAPGVKTLLTACRPEVLLVPAKGISIQSIQPTPSFLKRMLGVKAAVRMNRTGKMPINAVMFMIDTLRPDHTPPYGHPFIIAPHIDMLASLGTVFTNSYGAASQTRPSVGSMFSGLHPLAHGGVRHATDSAMIHLGVPMLAEAFQEKGFSTTGITSNAQVTNQFGFSRGFDSYAFTNMEAQVTPMGIAALKVLSEPFFLYLHYMGPHQPYEPAPPWKGMYQGKNKYKEQDAYSEEITLEDRRIGQVLKELSKQGLLNRTLIWLVSDHGEEFWEHDWNGHGAKLYEETVRTVSIVSYPGSLPLGQKIEAPATHADMFPTFASLFALKHSKVLQGIDLLPWLHGTIDPKQAKRPLFLHLGGGLGPGPDQSDKEAVLLDGKKLIWWPQKDEWEHYDLTADPGEKDNLIGRSGAIRHKLEPLLKENIALSEKIADNYEIPGQEESMPGLTGTEIEKLKRDGYLGGANQP